MLFRLGIIQNWRPSPLETIVENMSTQLLSKSVHRKYLYAAIFQPGVFLVHFSPSVPRLFAFHLPFSMVVSSLQEFAASSQAHREMKRFERHSLLVVIFSTPSLIISTSSNIFVIVGTFSGTPRMCEYGYSPRCLSGSWLGKAFFLVPISPPVRFEGVENRNFFFLDGRFCEQHLSEREGLWTAWVYGRTRAQL